MTGLLFYICIDRSNNNPVCYDYSCNLGTSICDYICNVNKILLVSEVNHRFRSVIFKPAPGIWINLTRSDFFTGFRALLRITGFSKG